MTTFTETLTDSDELVMENNVMSEKIPKIILQPEDDVIIEASNFSINQLNIQISILKSHVACSVCDYRNKECIIT